MSGGLITQNVANGTNDDGGGGVTIFSGASTFNFTGGEISNNTTRSQSHSTSFNLRNKASFNYSQYPNQGLITAANGFKLN
jgi:hypothetical protein